MLFFLCKVTVAKIIITAGRKWRVPAEGAKCWPVQSQMMRKEKSQTDIGSERESVGLQICGVTVYTLSEM